MTILSTLAFALDPLAIAAQALVGAASGASRADAAHATLKRCNLWGLWTGAALGLSIIATADAAPGLFTTDPNVAIPLRLSLIAIGLAGPMAGYVFVLDGVLIGAGDARYLAWTGVENLCWFVILLCLVVLLDAPGPWGAVTLVAAYAIGYFSSRAVTLGLRARGTRWARMTPA